MTVTRPSLGYNPEAEQPVLKVGRRYEKAIIACRQALDLEPGMTKVRWWLSLIWDPVRDHARFQEIRRSVGAPDVGPWRS